MTKTPDPTPTSDEELFALYEKLSGIATGLQQQRLHALQAGADPTGPQMRSLHEQFSALNDKASQILLASAKATLDSVGDALATIQKATSQAQAALDKLHKIDKAIAIGAAAIAVAAAVLKRDPGEIATAAKDLWSTVKPAA